MPPPGASQFTALPLRIFCPSPSCLNRAVFLLRQSAFDGFGKARIQAIVRRVDGPHFDRTFFCLLSFAFPLHGVLQSRMEYMPGHGVGVGFAGAVMAKQKKMIPATVNV